MGADPDQARLVMSTATGGTSATGPTTDVLFTRERPSGFSLPDAAPAVTPSIEGRTREQTSQSLTTGRRVWFHRPSPSSHPMRMPFPVGIIDRNQPNRGSIPVAITGESTFRSALDALSRGRPSERAAGGPSTTSHSERVLTTIPRSPFVTDQKYARRVNCVLLA